MDIWIYEASTERVFQITSTPEDDSMPAWSPDGAWLAFTRRKGTSHVYVADTKTHERTQLTEGEIRDLSPVVSPDGEWVAFVRMQPEGGQGGAVPHLYVMPRTGGEPRALHFEDLKLNRNNQIPAWSPDSREIAFSAADASGNIGIWRVGLDGGQPVQVTIDPGLEFLPSWSPDGKIIAYTRFHGGETQIFAVPARGGISKQITFNDGVNLEIIWARDSDTFAFYSIAEGEGFETWVSRLSRPRDARRVAQSDKVVAPVAWTEDGTELMVYRMMEGGNHICSMNPDGTGERVIADQNQDFNAGFAFTFEDDRYREALYQCEYYAFPDGEEVSDLYKVRITEPREGGLVARSAGS
jgi:Tol biopolymer transport system component